MKCGVEPQPAVVTVTDGMKVRRGPDWDWSDQDGGVGKVGTIDGTTRSWWIVRWPNGARFGYRYDGGCKQLEVVEVNHD